MDWGSAIVAGVVATAVMTILMYLGKIMGMPMDMPRMLGLMFVGPGSGAVTILGFVAHVMMGVVFAIIYVLLFNLFGIAPSWQWGAIFGAVHGVLAGLAFGMMPALHPRMATGRSYRLPVCSGETSARLFRQESSSSTSSSGPSSAGSTAPNHGRGDGHGGSRPSWPPRLDGPVPR